MDRENLAPDLLSIRVCPNLNEVAGTTESDLSLWGSRKDLTSATRKISQFLVLQTPIHYSNSAFTLTRFESMPMQRFTQSGEV